MRTIPRLLYIPGFNSNGVDNFFTTHYNAEIINYDVTEPHFVQELINRVGDIVNSDLSTRVIGNSLGGWIALKVCAALDIPVFLINPLVHAENMNVLIGEHTNFDTNVSYELTHQHVNDMIFADKMFASTIMEKHLMFAAIGVNDELINPDDFQNKYDIDENNILRLNAAHRLNERDKNEVNNSNQFKNFLNFGIN